MQYYNPSTRNMDWLRVSEQRTWQNWYLGRVRDVVDWATGYFGTTCEQFDLDLSGNRITTGTAKGREWVCSFREYRFGFYKMNIEVEGNGITSSGKYKVSTV